MAGYVPLESERFTVESGLDGETIRIKAQRQIAALLFLPIWLTGWTVGGIAAITQLVHHFEPFLIFWLCGWALGELFASGILLWMLTGSETLRIVGQDLEVAHHALGFSRKWLYQGGLISHLMVVHQPAWPFRFYWPTPFFRNTKAGAIRFDYGARTQYVGAGLDDAEGRLIVERLARRLPSHATDAT